MPGSRGLSVGARRCALGTAMALVATLSGLAGASAAAANEPTGEYAIFKECPRFTSGVTCIYVETFGGEVTIGTRTLRLERPLVLQGGLEENEQTSVKTFVGALNGETLSRAPQLVPGGLFGMSLYATLELIPPASDVEISTFNAFSESGPAVVLPVRMRLESPLLGSECYVGSRSSPIMLHLTTGKTSPNSPNKPISGASGGVTFEAEYTILELSRDVMVDNAFSMPVATGCGGSGDTSVVDSAIDRALGLPSLDGYGTIVEDNTLWEGEAKSVIASEGG
jgi:hypothetical protein